MFSTLTRVFAKGNYSLIAVLVAFAVFTLVLWLPNFALIASVFSSSFTLSTKLSILLSLYGSIYTNFTLVSALFVICFCVLVGINVSLFLFYLRKNQVKTSSLNKDNLVGLVGVFSGFLGIGCAACGAFILTYIIGASLTGALLAFLPLHGLEFALIASVSLLYSMRILLKKISDPLICPV